MYVGHVTYSVYVCVCLCVCVWGGGGGCVGVCTSGVVKSVIFL